MTVHLEKVLMEYTNDDSLPPLCDLHRQEADDQIPIVEAWIGENRAHMRKGIGRLA